MTWEETVAAAFDLINELSTDPDLDEIGEMALAYAMIIVEMDMA